MTTVQTNILALPIAHLQIETGNNEDWIDTIQYITPAEHQVDIRGIEFDMQIRRMPAAHEVILRASTENKWLFIGTPPLYGNLIIAVPERQMRGYFAGKYVGDVRARDDRYTRRILTIDLTIIEGITKHLSIEELSRLRVA